MAKRSKSEKREAKADVRKRIQIDFSGDAYDKLQELRRRLDASTNAEVIRRALGALELLLNERDSGTRLLLHDGKSIREIVTF
ncbi:MAG: hypothetical protein U0487_00530 [Patescibacteria group bacterium]